MKLFVDVTSSRRSMQSAGMQRMTRKIFAELSRPTDVRPIYRNTLGNFYTELGKASSPSTPESLVDSVLLTITGFLS
jgi:hypothetical protein